MVKLFKMKINFLIVIFFSISSLIFSQKRNDNKESAPFFYLDAKRYPINNLDSSRLDLHIKIPYSSIQFIKQDSNFVSQYELTFAILTTDNVPVKRLSKKYIAKVSNFEETYSSLITDMVLESIILLNNNFKLNVELMDLDTRKIFRKNLDIELNTFKTNQVISDLLLLDLKNKNSLFKDGFPVIPPIISDIDSSINIYYETISRNNSTDYIYYKISSTLQSDILNDSIQIFDSNLVFKNILNIPITEKMNSNFKIELSFDRLFDDSLDDNLKSFILIKSDFMGMTSFVNDVDEAIEQLRYIAFTDEIKKLFKNKTITKEDKLKEFWTKRDPTPETKKNELMNEYYRRVSFTNKQFQTWQKGWKTSMGMIFILFGPPDNIEKNMSDINGREYQRWNYIRINRSFTFLDYNGFGEFELLDPYNSTYGTRWR